MIKLNARKKGSKEERKNEKLAKNKINANNTGESSRKKSNSE